MKYGVAMKKYRFMLVKYRNFFDVHEQYNSIKGR